ncbi:diguanylate cyclase [Terasakiella sp. A23]|uniref:diguanylate cyclase n=1 Tax=Terasakiella sp. FCG-A23 TaxID=3080561 RepID=UPI002955614C|nr:diguanylate cyclase [Terasakiella sp. A23]MDV7339901.1 diguanylate cyclase [Terasakiella sp. A23]
MSKFLDLEIDWSDSLEKTLNFLETNGSDAYALAISCTNLSDAEDGEAISTLTEYQIPTIIFSSTFEDDQRENFLKNPGVVDYVVKESHAALRYLCNMVHRLIKNKEIKALVVDDSRAIRLHVCELLRRYQFKVLEAANGQEALDVLRNNRDIKLVVTDYNMTPIDGFELIKKIRETYEKEELAIVGLSGTDSATLSAKFIKIGANDFVKKPFQPEEFFCRVTQTIDLIEKTQALVDAATKDFLTGLYNRRFFFDKGVGKLKRARREKKPVALAMLDIDHFKSVNDTYGHDVGDEVLQVVANLLVENAREDDLVARFGGEEFCILLDDIEKTELRELFEDMREAIERREFASLEERKYVTSSFGVVLAEPDDDLDTMVKRADELLYDAKQTGRNKVTLEE